MPFAEINLVPSVNVETSPADNPSGVQESNFVRWRANLPEKRGGCTLYINQQLSGSPLALKPWGDFKGESFLGIATPTTVYKFLKSTNSLEIITPKYYDVPFASPTFSTSAGSPIITITDPSEPGVTAFDSVEFNTPVAIGGLILIGTYPIQSPSGTNTYTVDVGYPATATVTSIAGTLPIFQSIGGLSQIIVTFPIQYQYDSLAVGDRIGFTVSTNVGGIPIVGSYIISQILGTIPNQFIFQAQYIANSSATVTMNNGFVSLTYWITDPPGNPPP